MSIDDEKNINKVLKMNLDNSDLISNDIKNSSSKIEKNIQKTEKLISDLGIEIDIKQEKKKHKFNNKPQLQDFDEIAKQANELYLSDIKIENILSEAEIQKCNAEIDKIEKEFSAKTGIVNKTDLKFLIFAIIVHTIKTVLFSSFAGNYGNKIDKDMRLAHNDKSIEQAHRTANDNYRDNNLNNHNSGYWINILYQTPAYDITKGSADIGINMGGQYHRLYTLGHDPILGWIFGVINILTDTVTLNNFQTYKVLRNPMKIINNQISAEELLQLTIERIKSDRLNLPAAIFAQAQHLKSDVNTKLGLPIPVLSSFNEELAGKIYKENYDALCLSRDIKIIGSSFAVSRVIDMLISCVHNLYYDNSISPELYEVKTRKILLISNSIASSSNIISALITKNTKSLDIGALINTIIHLFCDTKFILKIKQEFIENSINLGIQEELNKLNQLYDNI